MTDLFDPPVGPALQELGSMPAPPPVDLEAPEPAEAPVPMVDAVMVRGILQGLGNMASMIDRAGPGLWQFTDAELDALAPPFTRLANGNETLRRALLHGDYVLIAMTLSGYAVRNTAARKEAVNAQRHRDQISGGARPGGAAAHPGSAIVGGGRPDAGPGGGSFAHGQGVHP